MKITDHFLKFSAIYLFLTTILVGVIFFAIDIYCFEHGNSAKWGGKRELFELAIYFHLITAISFSIGSFFAVYIFRHWLSTITTLNLFFVESLPALLLLIIIIYFKNWLWGIVEGYTITIIVLTGFLSRFSMGFVGSVLIFLILKRLFR